MRKLLAIVLAISMILPVYAQWFTWQSPLVPRNEDGTPDMAAAVPRTPDQRMDLSGLWVPVNASGSLYDSSRLRGWAQEAMADASQSFYRNDPRLQCLPSGPGSWAAESIAGGMRRIVQHRAVIAVLNEDMTHRQIYMDGRALEAETVLPSWMGYSIGRWDGNVLVVESNGFNGKTWLTQKGHRHTDRLRVTERYTRLNYGRMQVDVTYDDPGTFVDGPVEATIDLVLLPDATMFEVVCSEAKAGQRHYTGELDQSQQKAVSLAEEDLRDFVGVYEGFWGDRPVQAEVTLQDGELILKRTPRYSLSGGNNDFDLTTLVAQSANAFDSSLGLGWVFNRDEAGDVVSVSEVHVSGAWPLSRVSP